MVLKATDSDLIAAYEELGSVHRAGARFGMRGSSAHERLVKLGMARPRNDFPDADRDRLRKEYLIAVDAGKLSELAADMGRTKQFLCRQAKELGLTDLRHKRRYTSTWKYLSEEEARIIWEKFKKTALGLVKYCVKMGFDDLGFSACMRRYFPDEYEHVIESKQTKQTLYRYGRQFEYRIRDLLKAHGYVALRSPGSRTPIDLMAVRHGSVLFIQCKRSGTLNPKEWNALFDLAQSCGALAILASARTGRGHEFKKLIAKKSGKGERQPFVDWLLEGRK